MSVTVQPRADSPAEYMIIQPQSPEELILDSSISSRSKSDDSGESLEVTHTDSDDERCGNLKIDEGITCHVCDRTFNEPSMLLVHLTIHKVDFVSWKQRNYKKTTNQETLAGGVHCGGCTFSYVKRECFVSPEGSSFACTFCYESTRSRHIKNYGAIRQNKDLFEYAEYLIHDSMKLSFEGQGNRTQAPGRQLRLSPEEKVARVKAIINELKQDPLADEQDLCNKWSINKTDFDLYRGNTGNATTGKVTMPKTWKTETILPVAAVCPVTKLPLTTIQRIKMLLQETQVKTDPASMIQLITKYDIKHADLENYMSMIVPQRKQPKGVEVAKVEVPISTASSMSRLLASKNVLRLDPVTVPASAPSVSTPPEVQKIHDWFTGGKHGFPSMVQGISHIPRSPQSELADTPSPKPTSRAPKRTSKKNTNNICINCGTNTATLWRRIKSPEEIESKRPGLMAQKNMPHYTGKLACNSCALYWSLHGKHRVVSENSLDTPRKRNRRRNFEKDSGKAPAKQPKLAAAPSPQPLAQVQPPTTSHPNLMANLAGIDIKALLQLQLSLQLQSDPAAASALLPYLQNIQSITSPCEITTIKEEAIDETVSSESSSTETLPLAPSKLSPDEALSMDCSCCRSTILAPEAGQQFPCSQCFMCPTAIYCTKCIHSIEHLKLHSSGNGITNIDISTV